MKILQVFFGHIVRKNRRKVIKIEIGEEKYIEINGLKVDSLKEMNNQFDIVYFLPDQLRVVKEGPQLRRELVDNQIISLKPSYKKIFLNTNKLLLARNNILRLRENTSYKKEQIIAITKSLSTYIKSLSYLRREYIKSLNYTARSVHSFLTDSSEKLELNYLSFFNGLEEDEIYYKIMTRLDQDMERGYTYFSPQRDDIDIKINNFSAKKFSSQGQIRSIILSIKIAELENIKKIKGSSPIFLLDDVFSELDFDRRKRVLEIIKDSQSIITTNDLDKGLDAKIFYIREGVVRENWDFI